MATALAERADTGHVVLDIGDDVGALLVYTTEELRGREIDISPRDNAALRTHVEVLERKMGASTMFAAVFPTLPAGTYSIWRDFLTDDDVTIIGGAVVELDWRALVETPILRFSRPHGHAAVGPIAPLDLLPPRYREGQAVCMLPMGSAPMRFDDRGLVAWDRMWTDFCDLALAGGPPHRDPLLEPATPGEIAGAPADYAAVLAEIERGLRLVTGLPVVSSALPGWLGLCCVSERMARWLLRAIAVENVSVRREGPVLYLPVGPAYRLDGEIKNVITVAAKTHHYWAEHCNSEQAESRIGYASPAPTRS